MFHYIGIQVYDGILQLIAPPPEPEVVNNETLSNFLQSTLNNQTEKVLAH